MLEMVGVGSVAIAGVVGVANVAIAGVVGVFAVVEVI